MRALEVLNYLGALDDEGDMTELGRQMAVSKREEPFLCLIEFLCSYDMMMCTQQETYTTPMLYCSVLLGITLGPTTIENVNLQSRL